MKLIRACKLRKEEKDITVLNTTFCIPSKSGWNTSMNILMVLKVFHLIHFYRNKLMKAYCFVIQIDMTWSGEDLDSGIYNYQVALSTKPDNYPDIVQFLSTHSHNHFNFYHPGLYDGQLFYIRLKAQNRAGLVTNKVKIISCKCLYMSENVSICNPVY